MAKAWATPSDAGLRTSCQPLTRQHRTEEHPYRYVADFYVVGIAVGDVISRRK